MTAAYVGVKGTGLLPAPFLIGRMRLFSCRSASTVSGLLLRIKHRHIGVQFVRLTSGGML